MRIKSLTIFFNWIVCGMGLFGMTQYIGHVGGDIFLNFALSGIIQIPGNFLAWWTMNALGRRITLLTSNIIAGAAGLLLIFVNKGEQIGNNMFNDNCGNDKLGKSWATFIFQISSG
jgi:hypothetical protein